MVPQPNFTIESSGYLITLTIKELALTSYLQNIKQISIALEIKTSLTMGRDKGYPTRCLWECIVCYRPQKKKLSTLKS